MTFNFLSIIDDELKTENKKHQTVFDAYQVQHKINVITKYVYTARWCEKVFEKKQKSYANHPMKKLTMKKAASRP